MRIIVLLSLFILFHCLTSIAQGLNVELGFNNAISQSAFPVCNYNGNTYFVRYEDFPDLGYAKQVLSKHDTLGNLLWEREIEFDSTFLASIDQWYPKPYQTLDLLADSSGLYLFAYGLLGQCDVLGDAIVLIDKFSHDGQKLWTYNNTFPFGGFVNNEFEGASGFSLGETGKLYLLKNDENISSIITLDALDGSQIDSFAVELNTATSILQINDLRLLVAEGNEIKEIDSSGITMQVFSFEQKIKNLIQFNSQFYALIGDSIVQINDSLSEFTYFHDPNYSELQKLKVIDNQLWLTAQNSGNTHVLIFEPAIGLELVKSIPQTMQLYSFRSNNFNGVFDFNKHHITFIELFQLTERNSLRYSDYSLQDNDEFQRIDSDVGVVGIEVNEANITYSTSQINIQLSGKVCIKNFGNNPINSVRINKFHYVNYFNCSFEAFSEVFNNVNILPNDTAWFYCSNLYRSFGFYSPSSEGNPINLNLCVYSSHPNNLVDLNVGNDEGCESFVLGFHGVNSISSNNSNRKLLKIVDVLGRETNKQPGQLQLYIYDNGEVEKVFQTWQ